MQQPADATHLVTSFLLGDLTIVTDVFASRKEEFRDRKKARIDSRVLVDCRVGPRLSDILRFRTLAQQI